MGQKIIETIANACYFTSTPEELAKHFEEKLCVDYDYLEDWYINSNENENPHWTDKHIEELLGDFYLIPKR